jgi:hypothetical protein
MHTNHKEQTQYNLDMGGITNLFLILYFMIGSGHCIEMERIPKYLQFCQIMSFAILWIHNSHIQTLIKELSRWKL